MSKKIKVNIIYFGDRYCSDNTQYALNLDYYLFKKLGTNIYHNEYGPAIEYKDGDYIYLINGQYHRL